MDPELKLFAHSQDAIEACAAAMAEVSAEIPGPTAADHVLEVTDEARELWVML